MRLLKIGAENSQVVFLQRLLQKKGYILPVTGYLDLETEKFIKQYQRSRSLVEDGEVGKRTWQELIKESYNFSLGASNYYMNEDEWHKEYLEKDTIYLHHTAGLHRPDFTIDWWEKDNTPGKLNRVGTAFVIGRAALDGEQTWDGKVYRAFNEIYWAHHLGTKLANNQNLNQKSIGIEICSLGPLIFENGDFLFKSNNKTIKVPKNEVCELESPWRGFRFFQKYTPKQLEVCKELILNLAFLFDLPLEEFLYSQAWFEIDSQAQNGKPGLWSHCHVRKDKTDCFPQPELITMLNTLANDYKTFIPKQGALEALDSNLINKNNREGVNEDINFYSMDLN